MRYLFTVMVTVFFLLTCLSEMSEAQKVSESQILVKEIMMKALGEGDFTSKAAKLARVEKQREEDLKARVEKHLFHLSLQARIEKEITPGDKMGMFLKELTRLKAEGKGLHQLRGLMKPAGSGSISGTVTVGGSIPSFPITVLAFDEHGYFAGEGETDPSTGGYTIGGLVAGNYYVVTWSRQYVDEIYDNIPAPLGSFEGWRAATPVDVPEGGDHSAVNFDLQEGAHITGTVYQADGTTPITNTAVDFELTSALSPIPIYSMTAYTDGSGAYDIPIPLTGQFKLSAKVGGYTKEWYDNKTSWEQADVITITAPGEVKSGIDFSLEQIIAPPTGAIAGKVCDPSGALGLPFALVVAFDLADSTIKGGTISSFDFATLGDYIIGDLSPGQYIVYANDYFGSLMGMNFVGEYYQEALTPDGATPVPVAAGDTTAGINFTLNIGGSIAGKVLGPGDVPMDSIFVVAFDVRILDSLWVNPFFTDYDVGFAITDADGNYQIEGLPTANYILRTITPPAIDAEFFRFPGTHYGKVVDEYYDGVHSILEIGKATPVPVTGPGSLTADIDFTLDPAGAIAGRVTAGDGVTPVTDAFVIALDPLTGLPAWGSFVAGDGSYCIAPLAAGAYKLLAAVNPDSEEPYVSEFYDSTRVFPSAASVPVTPPDTTFGIDFTLDLGATIQGFVYLGSGFPAGADTLYRMPVVAYDAVTGKVVNFAFVQFPGGYRMERLPAGSYKVAVLPCLYNYAVTYYGGGDTFDDPSSAVIPLSVGQTFDADITLEQALGTISGFVRDAETGDPIPGCLVAAYDGTGHAVSMGFAGFDIHTFTPLPTDSYLLSGLRAGDYHVRTWYPTSFIQLIYALSEIDMEEGLPQFDMDLSLYYDEWYDDVRIPPLEYDPFDIAFGFLTFGIASEYQDQPFPVYVPIPYYSVAPGDAGLVTVTEPLPTTDINFELTPTTIVDILTGVEEKEGLTLPQRYALHQNYPNPFNPETVISYELPQASHVKISVYNLLGQRVAQLVDEEQGAGYHRIIWSGVDDEGRKLTSGVYLCRMEAGDFLQVRKLVLVR